MRVLVALIALLYVLAAFYGYFFWSERHLLEAKNQANPVVSAALAKPEAERLRFPDLKPAADNQLLAEQLRNLQTGFEARLAQLEANQAAQLKALQLQIDTLKQQNQSLAQAKPTSLSAAEAQARPEIELPTSSEQAPPEQLLDQQVQLAKQRLKANMSQLDSSLQTGVPDAGRQSIFQQKLEHALSENTATSHLQSQAACNQSFCKLEIQGKAPEGVDVLQTLWEQNVFPEGTEVMTIPKVDGSGWTVYVAQEGQPLPSVVQ
ncbi:MAG TPA: hypothetical protein PLM98_03580 [Thiolinea sp.]|nr:hypothetical protein [Thiolinea sp.]